ncbi:hypothetical protein [Streptomyces hokutonensis]|uniref:Uncharacterized protein n=1 Tax=Streptomyces hokutonensis TaxID=1306990 RepID=A0ABW6MLM4_9ACTN
MSVRVGPGATVFTRTPAGLNSATQVRVSLATLAALQGGLLLTQLQREVRPLEVALGSVLDHIESHVKGR